MKSGSVHQGFKERRRAERRPPHKAGISITLTPLFPGRSPSRGELVNISSGGMAIRLPKALPDGSHWALTLPGTKGPSVVVKMVRSSAEAKGHVHGFKFSSLQTVLAERLAGVRRAKR
jgi:c-di-GMP-binding flagellar brake protein YcgR